MFIPVILGTARRGRQSEKAAAFIFEEIKKRGWQTEIIDVREYRLAGTDNNKENPKVKKFAEKIKRANGLVIVSPEYNYSYPGELKMLLDMLFTEYKGKPAAIATVSAGSFGGARAGQQLKLLTAGLQMIPVGEVLAFSNIHQLFDDKGKIADISYYKKAEKFLDDLFWYVNKLCSN